jgi:hypothetical protein
MEGAGDPIEVIEPLVMRRGHPNETLGTCGLHPNQGAAVTQASLPLRVGAQSPPGSRRSEK